MLLFNKKVSTIIWYILLISILAFPRILQSLKIVLCILLIVSGIIENRGLRIKRHVGMFFLIWVAYSAVTIISGLIHGNLEEGIYAFIRVNIFNTILYIMIISVLRGEEVYKATIKAVIYSTLYISIYNIVFIGAGYVGLSVPFLERMDATARVGFHIGYTHIVTTNLSMSIMLFPLIAMLVNDNDIKKIVNNKVHILAVILCGAAMVLSGRRILWISLAIGLIGLYFYNTKNIKEKFRYLVIAIVVIVFGIYIANRTGLISLDGLVTRFRYAFTSTDEYGLANVREIQAKYMMEAFVNHPVFGNGAGAVLSGIQRSETSPWAYELSYHVVLFQSGTVGALFFFSALALIVRNIMRTTRISRPVGMSLLIAFISILIANATNPYFSSSFDFMIFIFLPFSLTEFIIGYKDSNQFTVRQEL